VADRLIVRGAREHNLKDVSLDLPRDSLIVFTGLSGSGKSSLAFDTIFAEGQRRYVESLSAYARQFLGQMDKPDVDFIEGLSPAVSIDQKSTSRNPRSTVGTITEVYDYLRLLYARAGRPHCPQCGRPIARQTPQQIVDRVLELEEGSRFQVLAPVIRERKGEYGELFPGPGGRRGAPAHRAAHVEEAGKAHHRGGGRPAGGEVVGEAPADRLGGDRAGPVRWPGHAGFR
jgi:excinuclease ABC subunit A